MKKLKTSFRNRKSKLSIRYFFLTNSDLYMRVLILIIFTMFCFIILYYNCNEGKYIVPENVVFLGDSITNYYDLDKYYPDNNVVNSGISGNVADDILSDMYNRVYKYNPSKVFLLIGTNQIPIGDSDDRILDGIKHIIDDIRENRPYAKIYIESIYPVNKKINEIKVKNRENRRIVKLNKRIKQLSKDKDYVEYINVYDRLLDGDVLNEDYSYDGLHLNDKGYEVVTDVLKGSSIVRW